MTRGLVPSSWIQKQSRWRFQRLMVAWTFSGVTTFVMKIGRRAGDRVPSGASGVSACGAERVELAGSDTRRSPGHIPSDSYRLRRTTKPLSSSWRRRGATRASRLATPARPIERERRARVLRAGRRCVRRIFSGAPRRRGLRDPPRPRLRLRVAVLVPSAWWLVSRPVSPPSQGRRRACCIDSDTLSATDPRRPAPRSWPTGRDHHAAYRPLGRPKAVGRLRRGSTRSYYVDNTVRDAWTDEPTQTMVYFCRIRSSRFRPSKTKPVEHGIINPWFAWVRASIDRLVCDTLLRRRLKHGKGEKQASAV